MLRRFVSIVVLAALPLAAESQTRHEHHHEPKAPAKSAAPALPSTTAAPARTASTATTSAFARYQRFTPDEPLKDWREVNDTVRAIGGWQAYGMEAARAIEAEKKAQGGKP